ncbi:MAG: hypothetical protein Q6363_003835, partial [Candidatus Njordarchaeota archaeon]
SKGICDFASWIVHAYEPLKIVSFYPYSLEIHIALNETLNITITLNSEANIEWYINGTLRKVESGSFSLFSITGNQTGGLVVTVHAQNMYGDVSQVWIIIVEQETQQETEQQEQQPMQGTEQLLIIMEILSLLSLIAVGILSITLGYLYKKYKKLRATPKSSA